MIVLAINTDNNISAYTGEVAKVADWCKSDNLSLIWTSLMCNMAQQGGTCYMTITL